MLVTAIIRAKGRKPHGSTKGERTLRNKHPKDRSLIGKEMHRKAPKMMRKMPSTQIKVAGIVDP